MSAFVWLAIPVVATIIAIIYFGFTGRKRAPIDSNSVADHEKFQAAMRRQNPPKP
jgi:hypothetical protein